jgi:tRNA-dihydrouridine synthase B
MGAYLLSQPHLLEKLVSEMVKHSEDIPISIKIRLGPKDKVNVLENARIIEDNGASMIIVHARTRNDKYDVVADWEWIEKVKSALSIPVIGNGSVFTAEDAVNMLNQTKCDGVLLGRGALGNPFIFREIQSITHENSTHIPEIEEIRDAALEHISLLEKEQGYSKSIDKAKKNIIWYFMYHNGIKNLIGDVYSAVDFKKLKMIVVDHSKKIIKDLYPNQDTEEIKQKFKNRVLFWLTKEGEKVS